jgi:hypothetical protein
MDNTTIDSTDFTAKKLESYQTKIENVSIGTSFNTEILPTSAPMSQEEAKAVVEQINGLCSQIRFLLVELEVRKGYEVLGFKT